MSADSEHSVDQPGQDQAPGWDMADLPALEEPDWCADDPGGIDDPAWAAPTPATLPGQPQTSVFPGGNPDLMTRATLIRLRVPRSRMAGGLMGWRLIRCWPRSSIWCSVRASAGSMMIS